MEIPASPKINLDQVRIEHAARARRDGDLVETLCAGIISLMEENERLRAELDLHAELDKGKEK